MGVVKVRTGIRGALEARYLIALLLQETIKEGDGTNFPKKGDKLSMQYV
jgi:hypothetical protein